jgi:hypothetical protein
MPAAEAHIKTERPSRYLAQLCRHVSNIYRKDQHLQNQRHRHAADERQARPQPPPYIEWSEIHGTITLGDGKIRMHADPGALTLRAKAANEDILSGRNCRRPAHFPPLPRRFTYIPLLGIGINSLVYP